MAGLLKLERNKWFVLYFQFFESGTEEGKKQKNTNKSSER